MHDINLINLIDLINNVLQPQNSGHLSSTLIEKLENLRENLKHGINDIIPEHFDEKYFSFNIINPRQMTETEINLTRILALLPKIKPSKLYLKNKRSNKREKRRCSRAKIKSNKKCRKHSRRPHCIPKF
jgi:hypothetical protein